MGKIMKEANISRTQMIRIRELVSVPYINTRRLRLGDKIALIKIKSYNDRSKYKIIFKKHTPEGLAQAK